VSLPFPSAGSEILRVHGLWDLIRQATEDGELDLQREDLLFFATPHPREVSVNSTRVIKVRGTDIWDLTYAERQSRRQMRQIEAFLRRYVPGFADAYLVQSGPQVGVREIRRILGEYELTAEDVLTARKHDDVIARCTYPIDIHNPTGTGTVLRRLPPGEAYDIPLRALIPQQVELCWWPDAAFPAVMRPSPPTASCLSPWPWGRRLVSARPWRPEGSTPPRIEAVRVQQELRRQEADLRGCGG
jgi:hypothetical protein